MTNCKKTVTNCFRKQKKRFGGMPKKRFSKNQNNNPTQSVVEKNTAMASDQSNKIDIDLREKWDGLSSKFCDDAEVRNELFEEIEKYYQSKGRHYHTLEHLEYLFAKMEDVKDKLEDAEMFSFAIFYHDIIFKIQRKDNEERSAALAAKRVLKLGVEKDRARHCKDLIESTETNDPKDIPDSDYLNDIDLAILGESPEQYKDYTIKIRKEFSIYPDFLFNPGRKNVLQHFLERENIYQTKHFRQKLENQARENIKKELESL